MFLQVKFLDHADNEFSMYRHSAVLHDSAMWVFGGMTDLQDRADFWKFDFSKSANNYF
jgi:hypothetical protein